MPWGARTRFSMVDPMTRFLNRIATPLTTSLFLVSLLTGLALFLHIGPQGLHPAHEWLSLLPLCCMESAIFIPPYPSILPVRHRDGR